MPGMLNLAAAGALDLGVAADITSDTMQAFGMKASEATHAADVFAYAQANANTNVEQMGEAMKYISPVANAFSWSLEETAAAQMALADSGLKGSIAGQAFASSLTRLAKPTKKMNGLWESTNSEFFTAGGQLKKMPDLVAELEKATSSMTEEQRAGYLATTFGAEAYKHWAILLERGSGELRTMTTELENADGAAAKMSDTMMDSLKGDWEIFISGVQEAAYSIYEMFAPALRVLVKGMTVAVGAFATLISSVKYVAVPFKLLAKGLRKASEYGELFFALITNNKDKLSKMMSSMKLSEEQLAPFRKLSVLAKSAIGVIKELVKPFEPVIDVIAGMSAGVRAFFKLLNGDAESATDIMEKAGITYEQMTTVRDAARMVSGAFEWLGETVGTVVDYLSQLYDYLIQLKDDAIAKTTEKLQEFTDYLKEHEDTIKNVAKTLLFIFAPAIAKVAFQAGIAAAVITGQFIVSLLRMAAQAVITSVVLGVKLVWSMAKLIAQVIITSIVITTKMIIALVRLAITSWGAVIKVAALTTAFIVQKTAMLVWRGVMLLVTAAQWLWNAALMANPIGLVVGLILGLIAVGILLVKNWDKVKDAWGVTWDFIKSAAEKSINFVVDMVNKLIETINKIPGVDVPLVAKVDFTEAEDAASKSKGGKPAKKKGKSHYHGIESVPFDGYQATLHRGERVQTAQEVRAEKRNGGKAGGRGVMITGNTFHVRKESDIDAVADALYRKLYTANEGGA